jgi:hypothetical protein
LFRAADEEIDPLIPQTIQPYKQGQPDPDVKHVSNAEVSGLWFYFYLLRQRRFFVGTASYVFYAMLVTSFDTTLPLHIRESFNWGSLAAGLLFICLQLPGIILTPLSGTLKDRVGTRYPTGTGFLLIAPFFWLAGLPGASEVSWTSGSLETGKAVYVVSVTIIGCLFSLFNGSGFLEATCK